MSNGEKNMGQTREQHEQSQFRPWEFSTSYSITGTEWMIWTEMILAPYVALLVQKNQNGEKLQNSLGLFQILEVTVPQPFVDF